MNFTLLFPTVVSNRNLDRFLTPEENRALELFELRDNEGNTSSIDWNVLDTPVFLDLKQFCEESLNFYLTDVFKPKYSMKLQITQSWLNFTKIGQYHHKHTHSNSLVSGVLYLQTTENDKIVFQKDDHIWLNIHSSESNVLNSKSWTMPATLGELYLFPSNLAHYVPPVTDTDRVFPRISLSFNSFPVGILGDTDNFNYLKLE